MRRAEAAQYLRGDRLGVQAARKRLIAGTVVAGIAATWLCYALYSTKPFQNCLGAKQDEYKTSHEIEEYPPKGPLVTFINARNDTVCAFSVLYDYRDAVTAVATIFIAFFTLTLWRSTDKLWKEAKDSRSLTLLTVNAAATSANAASRLAKATERQLRAYISVRTERVVEQNEDFGQPFVVLPDCTNDGQTPAHDVCYNARADVLPYPLPDDFDFPMKPEQAAITSTAVVGPRGSFQIGAVLDRFCDRNEIGQLIHGKTRRLYCYGTVRYRDAFGEIRHTNFCQSIQLRSDGTPLGENTKHHNDAT
jgi:hypothetical protein